MDIRLDGRLAVVTGAAGDIGRATAFLLAQSGARVVLLDRDADRLAEAEETVRATKGEARGIVCDVSSPDDVAAAFEAVFRSFGEPNILFNNAGICPSAPFEAIAVAEWDHVMAVNARSVFLCTQAVLPGMRRRGYGRIINNASQVAHRGGPLLTHYAASKGAILAFTHSLAHEVAADGVAVNAVCPGPIHTALMDGVPQDRIDRTVSELPVGRLGRPEEVAAAVGVPGERPRLVLHRLVAQHERRASHDLTPVSDPSAWQAANLDILAVGNALIDLTVEVDDDAIRRHRLPKGDMLLTDAARFRQILSDVGPPLRASYGGTACNTAAGLAAFGRRAAFVGKVADDDLGTLLRAQLAAADVTFVTASLPQPYATASCLILVTPDGQRTGVTHLGACGELGADDLEPRPDGAVGIVMTEAYLLDRPRSAAALNRALSFGRLSGAKVALTLADPHCVGRHRAQLAAILRARAVDILFANEAEAQALTGAADTKAALRLLAPSVPLCAVTQGAKGSLIQAGGTVHHTPAPEVDVVDATGAGDLFASGVLAGLLAGLDVPAAARLGAAAAAEAVSHFTSRPVSSLAPLLTDVGPFRDRDGAD